MTPTDKSDVIFLGAGASASDGAPLQSNLFQTYFAKIKYITKKLGNETIRNERYERLLKFFKEFFGIDPINNSSTLLYPTCEEAFGIIEMALAVDQQFAIRSSSNISDLAQIREDIKFSIIDTISFKLINSKRSNTHFALVSNITRDNYYENVSLVSTNYDILIDNAIIGNNMRVDYGLEFCNSANSGTKQRLTMKLYKIHGSLNWLYCPICNRMVRTPDGNKANFSSEGYGSSICKQSRGTLSPFLTYPTYFKNLTNVHFQKVWYQAERVLSKADRIFFCGYSFPDADFHIKYLLKRAEMARFSNKESKLEIYIINYHEGKENHHISEEYHRFYRFFRDTENIYYLKMSFENFANNYPEISTETRLTQNNIAEI
ncbi:MAG: SIR2 family protein [Candidatus Thorarchaeota archaeon]|nr:SIR2 family protein [Candidatus Thorarchaeota archaeon]